MFRGTVVAQALYGCEVRNIKPPDVRPLLVQGKQMIAAKAPLQLSHNCASEVIAGPPSGNCAIRDPRLEMTCRRLHWLTVVATNPAWWARFIGIAPLWTAYIDGAIGDIEVHSRNLGLVSAS